MKLTHDFLVRLPISQAWEVLTDLERIAPCMPGVHLDSVTGDSYGGRLKVKVGPITADYAGVARFVERDVEAWTVVWRAEGRETRGKGNAAATVTMELSPSEAGTQVEVLTDLAISGRLAQFGRGVLGEVSNRLLAQFVTALEREVAGDRQPAAVATTNGRAPAAPAAAPPTAATNLAELDWPDDESRPDTRERRHIPRDTDKTGPGTPGFNSSAQHRQNRARSAGGDDGWSTGGPGADGPGADGSGADGSGAGGPSADGQGAGGPGAGGAAVEGSLNLLSAVAVPVGKRVLVAGAVVAGVVLAVRRVRR